MDDENKFSYNNEEEAEMGQLHAIHLNMNAVAAIRKKIRTGPSLTECEDCGDDIPEARQLAVQGCTTCIYCQAKKERKK
jgi:phage/conjugal plasmid C-4 type zinc finger TraR family protein